MLLIRYVKLVVNSFEIKLKNKLQKNLPIMTGLI